MKPELSVDTDGKNFMLTPYVHLSSLDGLSVYISSIFQGHINQDNGIITIPIGSDIHETYKNIDELFVNQYGLRISKSDKASEILEDSEKELSRFTEFTDKALKIRNNEIINAELDEYSRRLADSGFKRTLKDYQLLASYHLAFAQNACNFSVPGSGKTTTVYAAFHYLKNLPDTSNKKVDKLLVVGPLSSFLAWKDEYTVCFGRQPEFLEVFGGAKKSDIEKKLLISSVHEEIILTNYQSLDSYKEILIQFLKNNRVMVVLDEAHNIKRVDDGLWSSAALELSKYADSRVILTGTPAANNYIDLFNLYKFIWPRHNIIGFSVGQLANMGLRPNDYRVDSLLSRISPFFIRVKKSDLKLPDPVFHAPIQVQMGNQQQKIYDAIADTTIKSLEQRDFLSVSIVKSRLIRLRQAATNPALLNKPLSDYYDSIDGDYFQKVDLLDDVDVDKNIMHLIKTYEENEIPSKFIETEKLVKDILSRGERVIIWAEFVSNLLSLSDYLEKKNIPNRLLYGGIEKDEREKIIKEFHQEDSAFDVIIANPHAVGESISLHKACHNAIYLEQSYHAGRYMQSKDRIHRVGLDPDATTNYYFLHSIGTVDQQVFDSVMVKENRMLELIEKEEIPLLAQNSDFMEDTEDDIKRIIRDYYAAREKLV